MVRPVTFACAVLVALGALGAACRPAGSVSEADDVYDGCRLGPGVTCRDRRLAGLILTNVDLRGADLRRSSFAASDLRGADLRRADLRGADFRGADLGDADLRGANLAGADLSFATLVGADLRSANLTGAATCLQLRPDWGLDTEGCGAGADLTPTTTRPRPTGPPEIVTFELRSRRCLNDAAGTAVEVRYRVRRTRVVVFRVDGVQALTLRRDRDVARVPFLCDGVPRTLAIEAYGTVPPPAERRVVVARRPGLPPVPPG